MKSRTSTDRCVVAMGAFGAMLVVAWPLLAQTAPDSTAGTASSQPAAPSGGSASQTDDETEPRREPSAAEILRELSRDAGDTPRPVILPSRPGQDRTSAIDPTALPANAVGAIVPKLYPDGYRIVDRPGRLTREGDYYTLSFESRGQGPVEPPVRLLPNRLLEDMEIVTSGATKPVVFLVSGEMTAYHGVNYLLVQKLLTQPNLGNLK
ncbi:hypothetical protein RAS2_14320 [Phycisphaerae bacterium RAS2]|nr:hypothetical protein RAS2_14320 [Phycisphaerae bacterium RAS2]